METKLSGVHTLYLFCFLFLLVHDKNGVISSPPPKSFSHFLGPWPRRLRIKMGLERDFHLMAKFSKSRNMLAVDQPCSYSYLLSTSTVLSITYIRYPPILYVCPISLLFSSLLFRKEKEGEKNDVETTNSFHKS